MDLHLGGKIIVCHWRHLGNRRAIYRALSFLLRS